MSHLVDELHALLRRPHPLQGRDRTGRPFTIQPTPEARGWIVDGAWSQRAGSTGELIWELLQRCRHQELWQLIDRERYRGLFPCGSSLEWSPEPLASWRAPAHWGVTAGGEGFVVPEREWGTRRRSERNARAVPL